MIEHCLEETQITTACILAAGTGSRLHPLTKRLPKCLTEVDGHSILGRLVKSLRTQGFTRLVFVVGHLEECIRSFLEVHASDMTIEYVSNPVFATTNNLYSLWLARDRFEEPFLLIESDLVFDASLLDELSYPDRIAVSHQLPWMNGTTVSMDSDRRVSAFCLGSSEMAADNFKTVNACTLSAASWITVVARLDRYVSEGRVSEYYEAVFRDLVYEQALDFECVFFDKNRWYEFDTAEDLVGASAMFSHRNSVAQALPGVG